MQDFVLALQDTKEKLRKCPKEVRKTNKCVCVCVREGKRRVPNTCGYTSSSFNDPFYHQYFFSIHLYLVHICIIATVLSVLCASM